ncbi:MULTISPECIES: DUF4235 domain-containing protein [unclassified Actinomyces]|uniref:DUF4235 domain-containing protein n=1 Tax=unclassified Actinomyces TaxID=2609248 RepID=UPI0013744ADE|nr:MULTISPECIES: DUF4235 domain-containing protein [unclassified Actinomyces]MBW3070341.1 DUF4235 domain-containing protein [Actinomyces sp. 594]NDR53070.1 DUF4235 domain-containing protein [Actinomyces sp. 565]QHO90224.1 hypothetical protein CWT12_01190 [Actinomyces sp. 432]
MKNSLGWTAASALSLLASSAIAERAVAAGWKAVTGKPAPQDEDQVLSYRLGEVVAFALVSGAIMTLTRQLTLRQAAKIHARRSGVVPGVGEATALEA